MNHKTGIELIAHERAEQILKHSRTIENDSTENAEYQLKDAAQALLVDNEPARIELVPRGWDLIIWQKMCRKSYSERMIIAAALLAAELDRLTYTVDERLKDAALAKLDNIYEDIKDAVNGEIGFNTSPAAKVVLDKLVVIKDIAAVNIVK